MSRRIRTTPGLTRSANPVCARCGSSRNLTTWTVDLDVRPVTTCDMCRAVLLGYLTDDDWPAQPAGDRCDPPR